MLLRSAITLLVCLALFGQTLTYSVIEDERIIREELIRMRRNPPAPTDHAKVARNLVHKAKWASVGTISTDDAILGFPMVNIMSIADGIKNDKSTGVIYFMSTTLDFTGKDILVNNKTTFMISDDEDLHCSKQTMDSMEPTCARIHISGSVVKMDESFPDYKLSFANFVKVHPAAEKWRKAHIFDLCKLNILNVYVLDYYGGPHRLTPEQYYSAQPDNIIPSELNDISTNDLPNDKVDELMKSLDYYGKPGTVNEVNIKISKSKYNKVNILL